MNFLKINKAYTLAEILIVLLLVAIIALASTPLIVKSGKKHNEKTPHGTYACTVFDGEEYVYHGEKKNSELPATKDGWYKAPCGTGFVMPYKSGLLNVKVIGGGGAGGTASADWDDSVAPRTIYDNETYTIPTTGYYDIVVSGSKGASSTISSWTALIDGVTHNCFAEASKPGDTAYFKGTMRFYKNDKIDVVYEHSTTGSLNLDCSNQIQTPSAQVGQNGQDIIVKRNSSSIVTVEGSKSGSYTCNSANLCGKHYDPVQGEKGKITTNTSFYDSEQTYGSSPLDSGIVVIRWSDRNNTNKAFKSKAGCGGTAGEIKSALYPILRDKLPEISVGKGGTANTEPGDTIFGSMKASGGSNNVVCTVTENEKDGKDGKTFSAIPSLNSQGGRGGISSPSDDINGSPATSFASGGGGGAIYYDTEPYYDNSKTREENLNPVLNGVRRWYQGTGGNGGAGLFMVTW